ncbi:MAG: asparagine synthase (glutamine-hydrolyzing) [Crocinitomicaceae bacterium]|nr:asparagine synthase (glutamine-hydrolyzing) [Crocinitomicaceae bacterium]
MCGISGIIQKNNVSVDKTQLEKMNTAIAHRGPDGEGFYYGSNFGLGHRRLAIIDLSQNGHQPMAYQEHLVITFNGEIYNYLEIREDLRLLGYVFTSNSDTEVILAAYAQWGEECVSRFNGMWAFAIFDKQKNILFCSRDRFGVKPFYFTVADSSFIFGSEIKQIISVTNKSVLNEKIALDYLIVGMEEHTNQTFFADILKLQPSHNLIYDLTTHHFEIEQYYQIEKSTLISNLNEQDSVDKYGAEFRRSILLRLRSDVKVGACLSGGLDSSSVAAIGGEIYKKTANQKFIAIHAKSSEKDTDESLLAKEVADFCDLDLHIVEPNANDFKSNLDEVIYTQEEPFGSPSVFMQYFVLQKARSMNCIVMLDGQGGDETLLGYEKYYPAYLMSLKGIAKWKGFMNASKNSKLSRKEVLAYFFYFTRYKLRLKRLKKRHAYFKASVLNSYESAELRELAKSYLDISMLQKVEITKTQLPHLLKYEDKNSMRNSVETRLPFLDFQTLETAFSIKSEFKIRQGWTKYVLRKAVEKKLPEAIVWRKNKLGFNAPEKTWLKNLTREIHDEIQTSPALAKFIDLEKLNLEKIDLRTKWRLFNFSKWQKLYNVEFN